MLAITTLNIFISVILLAIIVACSVGIIIASRFQKEQEEKYKDCLDIIKEKGDIKLEIKNGLTKEYINKIDETIDVNKLMKSLYNRYLKFIEKIRNNDTKLDTVLNGILKENYIKRLEFFKENGYSEVIDGIDLIGYSITEFEKNKLQFRITINCFDYKIINDNIISGNNFKKVEEVFLLTYEKIGNKWLITNYDKVYEKKLSD